MRGWALISVDYRLLPQVDGFGILEDITTAWDFVFKELAKKYSVDLKSITVAGQSAGIVIFYTETSTHVFVGGYLAYLGGAHFRPRPVAILSVYGPSTFHHEFVHDGGALLGAPSISNSDIQVFLEQGYSCGDTAESFNPLTPQALSQRREAVVFDEEREDRDQDESEYRDDTIDRGTLFAWYLQQNLYLSIIGESLELSPLDCMTKDFPPTVIIHGTTDRFVPTDLSIKAASRLESLGVDVQLHTVHGADHVFDHWAQASDHSRSNLWSKHLEPMWHFLDAAISSNGKSELTSRECPRRGFLDVAEALNPRLCEWTERPLGVVSFQHDISEYFGCRPIQTYTIDELSSKQWGRGDEFILDFGKHRVGYLSFHLAAKGVNIDAPVRLRFTFGEVPYDVVEELHPCNSWISTSWVPDEVINVDWCPTDVDLSRRYSFRYIRIQVIDTSRNFKILFGDIRVRAVSAISPGQALQPIHFTDKLLDQIDQTCILTLRNCMQTVFEDGPRRDRRLWSGDLRLQALTGYCTFQNYTLAKRCLYLFAGFPLSNGGLPACVFEKPVVRAASDFIIDYSALFGSIVYDYARSSGDLYTARDLWTTILRSMDDAFSHINTDGKYERQGEAWGFIDWEESLHKDAAMQGLLIFCCNEINSLARLLGKEEPYQQRLTQMREKALTFFDQEQGIFVSGPEKQVSWASQAWMSMAKVVPAARCKAALVKTLASPTAVKPMTPYLFHYVAEALAISGGEEECLDLIKSYWGGMLKAGADTFWECFDLDNSRASPYGDCHNNSYCHAWSCTPSYLLRVVLKEYLLKKGAIS